ncbi:hypothetical protein [Frondihabitans australicus]|uniref:Bacterial Ig-like domain-containing protein n=1 Tax=Frondihabitans australicus TaxID=386892 RepID=A0A495IHW2_9MICO|nr:hypothetical protein [Frondihabitans australicus]RKR75008.1 hypothetical protein C8E83_2142 [Frondihabitans australicus]
MTVLTDTTLSSTGSAATGGGVLRGAHRADARGHSSRATGRRILLAAVSISALTLAALGALAGGPSASAATSTPTPAPPTSSFAPATAPTISVADSDSSNGTAQGTGVAGDQLRVLDPAHPSQSLCTATVDAGGSWSCPVTLTSGAGQALTVRDLTQPTLPDVTSRAFDVLTEPVVSSPSGVAVGATVSGTGFAGATVTASLTGTGQTSGTTFSVTAAVSSSGSWSTVLPASGVPSGTYSVSAVQRSASVPSIPVSSQSNTVDIVIDRTAPAAPVLLRPAAGSTVTTQPFSFVGTGEPGATVTTYIDSNPVCSAAVSAAGSWSCSTRGLLIPAGSRVVQAAQRDAAGNYGPASPSTKVAFAAQPTSTPSAPSSGQPSAPSTGGQTGAGGDGSSGSGVPAPGGTTGGHSGGSGGSTSGGAPSASGGGSSGSSGSSGGSGSASASGADSSALDAAASWTAPTGFGHDLPTLAQSVSSWVWIWALVVGIVFVLLVIVPLRLAGSALGGRLAVRARRFTGRNRAVSERDESPLLPPAAAIAATIGVGAVLVALAFGVDDQLRYVRLVLAIGLGLALVNGLGAVLPTWVVGRRLGRRLRLGASPRLLLVAALACLAVRIFDLDPPLVLGVLVAATLVDDDGATLDETGDIRHGGLLATVQLSAIALVSFVAWVVHGFIPAASASFAVEVTREALATTCLAGLGSLVVLLVPLAHLPGRALLSWSRPTLVGLAVVGAALAAVVYAGAPTEAFPLLPIVVAALVFAVVAVSAWTWVRFVEPALDDAP